MNDIKTELTRIINEIEHELLENKPDKTIIMYQNKYLLHTALIREVIKMNYNVTTAMGTTLVIV